MSHIQLILEGCQLLVVFIFGLLVIIIRHDCFQKLNSLRHYLKSRGSLSLSQTTDSNLLERIDNDFVLITVDRSLQGLDVSEHLLSFAILLQLPVEDAKIQVSLLQEWMQRVPATVDQLVLPDVVVDSGIRTQLEHVLRVVEGHKEELSLIEVLVRQVILVSAMELDD